MEFNSYMAGTRWWIRQYCTSSMITFTEGESFLSSLYFPFHLFPFSLTFWASSLERLCYFLWQSHSQWPEPPHQLQECSHSFLLGLMAFTPAVVPWHSSLEMRWNLMSAEVSVLWSWMFAKLSVAWLCRLRVRHAVLCNIAWRLSRNLIPTWSMHNLRSDIPLICGWGVVEGEKVVEKYLVILTHRFRHIWVPCVFQVLPNVCKGLIFFDGLVN